MIRELLQPDWRPVESSEPGALQIRFHVPGSKWGAVDVALSRESWQAIADTCSPQGSPAAAHLSADVPEAC